MPYGFNEDKSKYELEPIIKRVEEDLTASDGTEFKFMNDGEGGYGYLGADDSFIPF